MCKQSQSFRGLWSKHSDAWLRLWFLAAGFLVFACAESPQTQAETQLETRTAAQASAQIPTPAQPAVPTSVSASVFPSDSASVSVPVTPTQKILILYLSRTNNTKTVAEMIQTQVGGTLVEIELETPYPENYQATAQQVQSENERGYLPPLKTKLTNLESYDVVFLGAPTWGMQLPPPIKSLLTQHPLAGKSLIPFNTNAGYGLGSSFETIAKLAPDAKIREGFTVQGGIERDGVYLAITGNRAETVKQQVTTWLHKVYPEGFLPVP